MEYTWLHIQPEMTVIGRARKQDQFYLYLFNGSEMIERASNLALIDGLRTECIVVYSFCEVTVSSGLLTPVEPCSEREL